MTTLDLEHYRAPRGWRWLVEQVWRIERAFEQAKTSGRAADDTRLRILFVLGVFAVGFVILAIGATRAAVFSGDGSAGAGMFAPPGARADLVDRNGQLLAVDLPHFGVYVDPREIWDTQETRRKLPAALPSISAQRLDVILRSGKRGYLIGGVTPEEKQRLHDLGLPGVEFEGESKRIYPLGATASHVLGFSDRGGIGIAGVERGLDESIRAAAGRSQVPLSIDLHVQAALDDEVRKAALKYSAIGAVGIVTNVRTGEVLGLSSFPDYDPNNPGASTPNALVNRAGSSVFEMGSIFKVFTLAMGLDSKTITMASTVDASHPLVIGRQVIHDHDAVNGVLTVPETFMHSSNIGTAKIALQAGAAKMQDYFRRFGLFGPAPIEINESARPIVQKVWSDNVVASASFGNTIAVTPLAVAAGMGAVLNGGTYVPLTIRKVDPAHPVAGKRVISQQTSREMLDLMRLNVEKGTGGKANAPGLRVGGKTGSNEKAIGGHIDRNRLVSSFAAVFPTDGGFDQDRYFVLILLDEPKGIPETYGFAMGAWNAAPTVGKVIDRIAPFLHMKRVFTAQDLDNMAKGKTPLTPTPAQIANMAQ